MANMLGYVMIAVFVMSALCEARRPMVDLRRVTNDDVAGIKDPSPATGPQLMYCMGKFMRNSYHMSCHIPAENTWERWSMNDVPLTDNKKYRHESNDMEMDMEGDGTMTAFRSLELTIMDLGPEDIGKYTLSLANAKGTSVETFYLTDIEACQNNMLCYENPCSGIHASRCDSLPHAHCVVDMCSSDHNRKCQPFWYVGLEPVTCPGK